MNAEALLFVVWGGFVVGALYAVMASGLAVVWTTLGIFNFAHGAFIALGAYLAWQLGGMDGGAALVPAALAAVAALFLVGAAFHFVLVRPFERKENIVLASVITTLAGAAVLQNVIQLIWGVRPKQIAPLAGGGFSLGPLAVSSNELALTGFSLAALFAVGLLLRRTRTGRAMRAVAENREAAELMGLNVPALYALAFGLSAALAGLGGIMVGSIRFMNPAMGADPLLKALIVVIFGGVARFTGPVYAGFIIGMIEAFAVFYAGLYWAPAVLFALMIAVLIVKPEGLFGRKRRTL